MIHQLCHKGEEKILRYFVVKGLMKLEGFKTEKLESKNELLSF